MTLRRCQELPCVGQVCHGKLVSKADIFSNLRSTAKYPLEHASKGNARASRTVPYRSEGRCPSLSVARPKLPMDTLSET